METCLKFGVYGAILAFVFNYLIYMFGFIWFPPFLPAFIAVIAIIAIFRIDGAKEALVVALTTYFFSNEFFGALAYFLLYSFAEPVQVTVEFDVISLINLIITPITAVVAAYLGTYFVKSRSIDVTKTSVDDL